MNSDTNGATSTMSATHHSPDPRRTSVSRTAAEGEELSTTIVLAVAEALDTDPLALSPALFEVVAPDALDDLFDAADENADVALRFSGWGCTITVFDDRVRVTPDT